MKNFLNIQKKSTWVFWLLISAISFFVWLQFSFPRFSFINLSVNRQKALKIAEDYLSKERGIDTSTYLHAQVLRSDNSADRYLQKTLGIKGEREFLKEHDFNLFYWKVRFFREKEQEEYSLVISSKSGQVLGFAHNIKEIDARRFVTEDEAQKNAEEFLSQNFGFDPELFSIYAKSSDKLENRVNYSFIWQKNSVSIPWTENKESPPAKLLMKAVVSGDEILLFTKENLTIPDQFSRHINQFQSAGSNLSLIFNILNLILITAAIFFVVSNHHHLIMRSTKRFYIFLIVGLFILQIIYNLICYEIILSNYPTTASIISFWFQNTLSLIIQIFIFTMATVMPGLAGESLRYEIFPERKEASFLHYIRSTFFSRAVSKLILLGYLVAVIMIGLQSALFAFGYRFLGVWMEYAWFPQFSSSYLPFLSAFIISFQASVTEEITFRLFSIHWFKKVFKNIFVAAFLASIIWGFGHGNYQVFPMWFRGIEVSVLGFFLSFIYLRYGLICTIVAHYLFDAFWGNIAFLIGKSDPFYFGGSLFVLLLPLLFAVLAFILNRKEEEGVRLWKLNKHQLYNLQILQTFVKEELAKNEPEQKIKEELISHGWDIVVVEKALKDHLKK